MRMHAEASSESDGDRVTPQLPLAMRELRRSCEPSVVLSSLARSCVPTFSDGCVVELSEGLDPTFRVAYPLDSDDATGTAPKSLTGSRTAGTATQLVMTFFEVPSTFGQPASAGVVTHSWDRRCPTSSDAIVARLLVDEALAVVQYERLAEVAAGADRRSARLAVEAITARTIGLAIGLLMAGRDVNEQAAFELLRSEGRASGQTLHDVALGVVHAGGVEHAVNTKPVRPNRQFASRVQRGDTTQPRSIGAPELAVCSAADPTQ